MKLSIKIVQGCLLGVVAGAAFLSLSGCGTDMLTYAQDAKHAGIGEYNDGRYAEATGSFRNAVRQDPTDAEAEYWLGLSYEQTGSFHEAINAYKTSLALLPEPGSARYNGQLHDKAFDRLAHVVALQDPTSTETDLIVQTASDQKSPEQYWLLGRIFRYRGDPDTAMTDYHQSVQLNPDNFAVQKELGLYLEQLGQIQEASVALRDAYRLRQLDDEVNAALQRVGMTPGPGLMVQTSVRTLPPVAPIADPSLGTPAAHTVGPVADPGSPRD